jgi:hypothetical protein
MLNTKMRIAHGTRLFAQAMIARDRGDLDTAELLTIRALQCFDADDAQRERQNHLKQENANI